jgi:hypothetical protein
MRKNESGIASGLAFYSILMHDIKNRINALLDANYGIIFLIENMPVECIIDKRGNG